MEIKAKAGLRGSVPAPILLRDDLMAMSALPGIPLKILLRKLANTLVGWKHASWFREIGSAVGIWLTNFQKQTASGNEPFFARDYLIRMEVSIAKCREMGLSESVLASVFQKAKHLSTAFDGKEIRVAGSHGEFLPQNILIHDGKVGIVDFDTYGSARVVYQDPALFLGYLALSAKKTKYSRRAILSLAEGFLSGYKQKSDPLLLRLYLLNAILQITSERKTRHLGRLERREVELTLRNAIENGFPPTGSGFRTIA